MPPSAGNVITSPIDTVTGVPLFAAVDAVALNEVVLLAAPAFVPFTVAPMLTTSPVRLPAAQAFANCNVAVRRVFVYVHTAAFVLVIVSVFVAWPFVPDSV